ncbi:hypothetical protein K2X33_03955 [bacterium]|nr:hypothetical protein [bacterium]
MSHLKWILAAALVVGTGYAEQTDQLEALSSQKERPAAIVGVEHEGKAYIFELKNVSNIVRDASKKIHEAVLKGSETVEEALAKVNKDTPEVQKESEVTRLAVMPLILKKDLQQDDSNEVATYLGSMPLAKKVPQDQLDNPALNATPSCGCFGWGRAWYRPLYAVVPYVVAPVAYAAFGYYPGFYGIYNAFAYAGFGGFYGGYGWYGGRGFGMYF